MTRAMVPSGIAVGSKERFVVYVTFRKGQRTYRMLDDVDGPTLNAAIRGWMRDGYGVDIERLWDREAS